MFGRASRIPGDQLFGCGGQGAYQEVPGRHSQVSGRDGRVLRRSRKSGGMRQERLQLSDCKPFLIHIF